MIPKKVFLSSTYKDLKEYREAAYRAIKGLDGYHCVRMEDFGARDYESDEFCHARVEECNLFVGIVGHLYGSCPDGCEASYTEQEYDAAVGAEIPRLMFVATDAVSPPTSLRESDEIYEKQRTFRKRVDSERIRDSFESPEDLSGKIRQAIHNWEREQNKRSVQKGAARAPFQAPPLPEHFIPRPEKSEEVKRRLLTNISDRPGVLVVSALHGLGGIGKTVLASSLAHDPDIQKRFSDGVLWTTLGQEPQILSLLNELIRELGDHDFPTTPAEASAHLRSLLHDRAVLQVVDDAWKPEHVKPFLVGGPNSHVLVTTRRASVADETNAELYELDEMTPDQSLELFSSRLGRSLTEAERDDALLVAELVGHLPLALELAAERIRRKVSWKDLKDALEKEISFLEGPRRRRTGETRLNACLNLSFKALYSDDKDAWRAFVWLGILPEDLKITAPMAATLWGLDDETEAEDLLELFWDEALLLHAKKGQFGEERAYRIHDLLHERAVRFVEAPITPQKEDGLPGLGMELIEAHSLFLDRYKELCQSSSSWHTLPDDGYIHTHLVWHMEKANRIEEIHALLREETPEGENGWYQARDRLGQTGGFIEDVASAWKLSEDGNELGLQIFYALTTTSIKSLSANFPPKLFARILEYELWTVEQGLSYALQIPDLGRRDRSLAELAKGISTKSTQKALEVARRIQDGYSSAMALAEIAPKMPDLKEALKVARTIKDDYFKVKALAEIASRMQDPQDAIDEAMEVARKNKDDYFKARALAEIAANMPDPQEVIDEAKESARKIHDDFNRVWVLVEIAPKTRNPQKAINEAMDATKNLKNDDSSRGFFRLPSKDWALAEIAAKMPNPKEALGVVEKIQDEFYRAMALAQIAPNMRDPREALEVAEKIHNEYYKATALAQIASNLADPQEALNEAIEAARKIQRKDLRADTLVNIAPNLIDPKRALNAAIEAAREIQDDYFRVRALAEIAPHMPNPHEALDEAIEAARNIEDDYFRARAWSEIAPHMPDPKEALNEAMEAAKKIQRNDLRVESWSEIASHMLDPQEALNEAMEAARNIEDVYFRARAWSEIASNMSDPQEALKIARNIQDTRNIAPDYFRGHYLEIE